MRPDGASVRIICLFSSAQFYPTPFNAHGPSPSFPNSVTELAGGVLESMLFLVLVSNLRGRDQATFLFRQFSELQLKKDHGYTSVAGGGDSSTVELLQSYLMAIHQCIKA